MATTTNICLILKHYASKQKSPLVDFNEFAEYLKRYANHHLAENPELAVFIRNNTEAIQNELIKLSETKQVVLNTNSKGKQDIFVLSYYIEYYTSIYKEIDKSHIIPFPNVKDLPKNTPSEIVTKVQALDIIFKLLETNETNDKSLYGIYFSKEIPAILFPSTVSVNAIISIALNKIAEKLRKDQLHEYFLKKLTVANPGKEITAKNFFKSFTSEPDKAFENLKEKGDNFYYWSQMCYFIRQDYDNIKDLTAEDTNVLQSVCITEIATSFFKTKAQNQQQKETAFRQLEDQLQKAPYYFNFDAISGFKDNRGKLLLETYTLDDLKAYLHNQATDAMGTQLPQLLTIRISDREVYFAKKEKVVPLILRLCNDARISIREALTKQWCRALKNFETLPEMKENPAFEKCLQRETTACSPVLQSLLHSSFLNLLAYEEENLEDSPFAKLQLFKNDQLVPYSELLLISRADLYTDCKMRVPFYYTMPIISWFAAFMLKKPKLKTKQKKPKQTAIEKDMEEKKAAELKEESKKENIQSRKAEFKSAAKKLEKSLVPENSTLDRELEAYLHEWNVLIAKESHDNLTDDVNNLIRDYMRKVLRTLKATNFTLDRIKSLAESLVESPSMMKIKNHSALQMYTELYMIKLVKNIP